jgi:GTPase
LHVIVEPGWRESKPFVESLDWRSQLEELAGGQAEQAEDERESE